MKFLNNLNHFEAIVHIKFLWLHKFFIAIIKFISSQYFYRFLTTVFQCRHLIFQLKILNLYSPSINLLIVNFFMLFTITIPKFAYHCLLLYYFMM